MTTFAEFHQRSIEDREGFWNEQAQLIDWHKPYDKVCDYSDAPFAKWFVNGQTNLCYNAVDRHVEKSGNQKALIYVSTETGDEKIYTFKELSDEVQRFASIYKSLGISKGDRILIYMPMIPEACFAMLAAVRLGAIHSVVFGGFASHSLATRIDDAALKVIVSSDAGMRGGKVVPYKHLLDQAIEIAENKPDHVLMVDRRLAPFNRVDGRDMDYATLRQDHLDARVPCEWVDSNHPSYILYTSGTTGKPKGVQRDTAGYAVALAASMKHIYMGVPGETFFSTSDIGWVVGHSYIIYGPLLGGMATILFEGLPTQPDAGIWWSLVEKYKVSVMFSAPTALRVLKKHDSAFLNKYELSSLKALFLAGEPLDKPTSMWIAQALQKPVVDNYWQTETGWPILSSCNGVESTPSKFGSPGKAVYGYDVKLIHEDTGQTINEADKKGVIVIEGPLPPGCLQTIWQDDRRFVNTYWTNINGKFIYSTFDWGIRDEDGYFFILGRTDDVINVAGHRLGTREIEESISSHSGIAEAGVVGIADQPKGQVAVAFAVPKDSSLLGSSTDIAKLEAEVLKMVDAQLGAVARPSRVYFVASLPKTRSGKLLRRTIQAVCEGRDPGDLTTIEDPAGLQHIKDQLAK